MDKNTFPKFVDNDGNELDLKQELDKLNKKMDSKIDMSTLLAVAGVTATFIVGSLTFTNAILVKEQIDTLDSNQLKLEAELKEVRFELKELRDEMIRLKTIEEQEDNE